MINRYSIAKVLLSIVGIVAVPLGILTKKKDGSFRSCFFIWDNLEDGDGNKWLREHRPHLADKWWTEFYWKALRNPAWNMRYVNSLSLSALPEDLSDIRFEGNTHHKGFQWSFASGEQGKVVRERVWFKFSAVVAGKRRYCEFECVPINDTESRARFKGWKFYPHLYLDPYWTDRIKESGLPPYKDRVVYTNSNRVQEM